MVTLGVKILDFPFCESAQPHTPGDRQLCSETFLELPIHLGFFVCTRY